VKTVNIRPITGYISCAPRINVHPGAPTVNLSRFELGRGRIHYPPCGIAGKKPKAFARQEKPQDPFCHGHFSSLPHQSHGIGSVASGIEPILEWRSAWTSDFTLACDPRALVLAAVCENILELCTFRQTSTSPFSERKPGDARSQSRPRSGRCKPLDLVLHSRTALAPSTAAPKLLPKIAEGRYPCRTPCPKSAKSYKPDNYRLYNS